MLTSSIVAMLGCRNIRSAVYLLKYTWKTSKCVCVFVSHEVTCSSLLMENARMQTTLMMGRRVPADISKVWMGMLTTLFMAKTRKVPSTPGSWSFHEYNRVLRYLTSWKPEQHPEKVGDGPTKLAKQCWVCQLCRKVGENEPTELRQDEPGVAEPVIRKRWEDCKK